MASYHNFTYLGKSIQDSFDQKYMTTSFDPDDTFVDTYLGTESIYTSHHSGEKRYFYGAKYKTTATISITIVKRNGEDFSIADNREILRWLTGVKKNSWLDLYEGNDYKYSFFGHFSDIQQRKLDARVIGIQAVFEADHPWAWSGEQTFNCYIGQGMLAIDGNGVLYKEGDNPNLGMDENGVLFNDPGLSVTFNCDENGVIYNDTSVKLVIDNPTDDLYSYTYLNLHFKNEFGTQLSIKNLTLEEETLITDISLNEEIDISAEKFIVSSIPNKIFGDTFNFVWPRLAPGRNTLLVTMGNSDGKGNFDFSFRYPIKIGDCAMDDYVGVACSA